MTAQRVMSIVILVGGTAMNVWGAERPSVLIQYGNPTRAAIYLNDEAAPDQPDVFAATVLCPILKQELENRMMIAFPVKYAIRFMTGQGDTRLPDPSRTLEGWLKDCRSQWGEV